MKLENIYKSILPNGQLFYKVADKDLMNYNTLYEELINSNFQNVGGIYPCPASLRSLGLKDLENKCN